MPRPALVLCRFLDPRPAAEAAARPIDDAVNIPFGELAGRTHELPPRGEVIPVVGPPALAEQVVSWLVARERRAVARHEFRHVSPSDVLDVGRLWRPNAFLAEVLPQLPPRSALDLACGTGRDAVFLAARGWTVTAADVLPDALERARGLAERCTAAVGPLTWRQMDLEREDSPPTFAERFDLIVGFRYLHRPLFGRLRDWLNPGGSLIWETFTTEHRARYGRPAADAHVLQLNELPRLLTGFRARRYSEAWHGRAHTARVWATLD